MKYKIIKKVIVTPKKVTIHYKECQNSPIVNVIERDTPMTPEQQSHFSASINSMIQDALEILEEDKRQEDLDFDEEDTTHDESEPDEEPEGDTQPEVVEDPPESPEAKDEQTSEEEEPTPKVEKPAAKKRGRPRKKKEPEPEPKVESPEPKDTGLRPPGKPEPAPEPNVSVPDEGVVGDPDGMEDEPSPEEDAKDWSEVPLPLFENSEMPEWKHMEKDHLIWYVNNNEKDVIIEDVKWNFNESISKDSSLQNIRVQALEIAFDRLGISH